ncbi:MAG: mechanosensitive ion channel family protein [Granulosicoccus sp.]
MNCQNVLKYCSLVLLLTLANVWSIANAQSTLVGIENSESEDNTEVIDPTSPEQVRELVSRLSDQEVRLLLLDRLDAVVSAQSTADNNAETMSSGAATFLKFWAAGVAGSIQEAVVRLPDLFTGQLQSFQNFVSKRGISGTFHVVGIFLSAILLGYIAERLVRHLTRNRVAKVKTLTGEESFRSSLKTLSWRFFLDLIALLSFFVVATIFVGRFLSPVDRELCNLVMFNIVVFPRFMVCVSNFLLAPNRPELRLVHTDDRTAKVIHKHALGLFLLMGFTTTIVGFNALNGIPVGSIRIGFWLNLAVHLYVIYIAWSSREGLKVMLLGKHNDVTPMEARIAGFYPYFLVAITVLVWLILELVAHIGAFHIVKNQPQLVTILIFLFIPAMDTLIRALVTNMVAPMPGEGFIATRAYNSTKRSYLRIGRVLVFGFITLFLMDIWHVQLNTMASDAVGATVASNFIRLLIILSIGYLIWELVSLFFNRKLAAEDTAAGHDISKEDAGGGEGGGTGSSRLATILPLFRFTVQTIVVAMTILIALSNIGINATPLLAGAGVVGIAVGFGAQKLVTDVVSGIFFLIDDAFRAGEYVSIEGTVGTVEKISLRSLQLRHHRGAVHTIPYGEIPKLTNYSRDWVLMKLKFTVPFNTDLKKVKNLFKKIGSEVVDLPQFSDDLLQPFKSQGVLEVNDVGIVVGGKFMAKPGTQFMMRKELFLRIQKAFDQNGIQFARKEVRVRLDGETPEHLTETQLNTIAGAAADAIDEKTEVVNDHDKR